MTQQPIFSAPLGTLTTARLEIIGGSSNTRLRALAMGTDSSDAPDAIAPPLLLAAFEGTAPQVSVTGGSVIMSYHHFWRMFGIFRSGAEIGLYPGVDWEICLRGGSSMMNADLAGVRVSAVEIRGGVSDLKLALPRPRGTVKVRIGSGVSEGAIFRPAGVPVRVSIRGGASALAVDQLALGSVGGPFAWESPDYASAADRFEIEITGGVSDLTVRAEGTAPVLAGASSIALAS